MDDFLNSPLKVPAPTNNKTLSRWRFFNIKENPAYLLLLLLICILVADIFLFQTLLVYFKDMFPIPGTNLGVFSKQPYRTNLQGYIGLIYPLLIAAYSITFYKSNSVFFRIHLIHKCIYIALTTIASIYFVLTVYNFLTFSSACGLDYLGACGWGPVLGIMLGLIVCILIFFYSLFIFGRRINEFTGEETGQQSILNILFILFFFLMFWGYAINAGVKYSAHKFENRVQTAKENFSNAIKAKEDLFNSIARSNKDICSDSNSGFFLSSDSHLNFPTGSFTGIGYVFVSYENYWDGTLTKETDGKYVTNFDYINFSKNSVVKLESGNAGDFLISKNLKYDVRVVLIKDPVLQQEIENNQVVLIDNYGGSFLKRYGSLRGEGEIPINFSHIFPNEADCATVAVQ